jgi:hypothetical protein
MDEIDEKRDHQRSSLVGPVILIGLGVVFLLNNLGVLDWSVWDLIIRLWPVLLVAAGLDILIGRRSTLGALLSLVLTVILVGGALWLYAAGLSIGSAGPGQEISQPLDGATKAEIVLGPAVGSLHVESLQETDHLVAGLIHTVTGERVSRDFEVVGDTAAFTLESHGQFAGPFFGSHGGRWGWDLGLSPDVPLDLRISFGVGRSDIDLTDLTISDLEVDMGIGLTHLTLPSQGRLDARVDGAIGNTVIVIPRGMEARIQFDTGLAARQAPQGYRQQDDVYVSPGYAGAENRVDLKVSQAIGNVTVQQSRGQ